MAREEYNLVSLAPYRAFLPRVARGCSASAMSLLITGGLGFLGLQTASALLRRGVVWSPLFKQPVSIKKITLFDIPAAISAGAASVP